MSATLLALVKGKKDLIHDQLTDSYYNHPHRIESVNLSGTLDYVIDERDFTANASPSNGDIAYVYTYDLDFSGTAGYTRIFESRYPWISIPSGTPAQGEFVLAHRAAYIWRFEATFGADLAAETIGTVTRAKYIYASGSWGLDSTDAPQDIELEFSLAFSAGGDPTSGGRDGDSDDEKASIYATAALSGTYATLIPLFSSVEITRFPWDDPWSSESTAFSDIFTDHITTQNTTDGGGHSGTCTITIDFT